MGTLWMQELGLTLCLFGAVLLPIVEIRSKKEIIAESGTYVDGNPYVKQTLTHKKRHCCIFNNPVSAGFCLSNN
jgi:hypothetical protein